MEVDFYLKIQYASLMTHICGRKHMEGHIPGVDHWIFLLLAPYVAMGQLSTKRNPKAYYQTMGVKIYLDLSSVASITC